VIATPSSSSDSVPVIPGFYPDPSVCRVGDTYYLANSSFEYAPGVPLWKSDDLVRWEQIGHALDRPSHIPARAGRPSGGIFAPTLRHHGGRFWVITTDYHRIYDGQLIVSAEDPGGPWTDPVFVSGAVGIDPDLAWDDDGTCFMTWASFAGLQTVPVDPATGHMLGEPRRVWSGTGLAAPEGPHLYRIGEWWYLLIAEGGTERGHTIAMARARTLDGDWEPAPMNPVLSHRSTSHPVQNVGHGDLVQRADGSWALVYLGVRARGFSPLFHTNGRETFLAGVEWVDGWPVVDEAAFDVPPVDTSFDDDFTGTALEPRWIAPGRYPSAFTELTDSGLLINQPDAKDARSQLCVRVRDLAWEATIELDAASTTARFCVRMNNSHWYGLDVTDSEIRAVAAIGPVQQSLAAAARVPGQPLVLRVAASPPPADAPDLDKHEPDFVELSVRRVDGVDELLARLPGRYLSTEVVGGFTGRVLAVEALDMPVTVRRIAYRPVSGQL
jgi:hypothetical protein